MPGTYIKPTFSSDYPEVKEDRIAAAIDRNTIELERQQIFLKIILGEIMNKKKKENYNWISPIVQHLRQLDVHTQNMFIEIIEGKDNMINDLKRENNRLREMIANANYNFNESFYRGPPKCDQVK